MMGRFRNPLSLIIPEELVPMFLVRQRLPVIGDILP